MTASNLFSEWLRQIAVLAVVVAHEPADEAKANTTLFSIEDARSAGATVAGLADFLLNAFRAYCVQAARVGLRGWFYAWHDEMSGTVRCSVAEVLVPSELPFSSTLDLHDDPETIAQAALMSPYASGIPLSELEDVERTDPDTNGPKLVLSVFVRRLISRS